MPIRFPQFRTVSAQAIWALPLVALLVLPVATLLMQFGDASGQMMWLMLLCMVAGYGVLALVARRRAFYTRARLVMGGLFLLWSVLVISNQFLLRQASLAAQKNLAAANQGAATVPAPFLSPVALTAQDKWQMASNQLLNELAAALRAMNSQTKMLDARMGKISLAQNINPARLSTRAGAAQSVADLKRLGELQQQFVQANQSATLGMKQIIETSHAPEGIKDALRIELHKAIQITEGFTVQQDQLRHDMLVEASTMAALAAQNQGHVSPDGQQLNFSDPVVQGQYQQALSRLQALLQQNDAAVRNAISAAASASAQ